MGRHKRYRHAQTGFTIVEMVFVVVVIAILFTVVGFNYLGSRDRAKQNAADIDISSITSAVNTYLLQKNAYPVPVNDGLPSGLASLVKKDSQTSFPNGPWDGTFYEYDAWNIRGTNGTLGTSTSDKVALENGTMVDTIQISLRFCTIAEQSQSAAATCKANVPRTEWGRPLATSATNNTAYYYCVRGYCRPNGPAAASPQLGYCVNCPDHTVIKYDGE